MKADFAVAFAIAALVLTGIGCGKKAVVSEAVDPDALQMFAPLPKEVPPASEGGGRMAQ